jgi:hypothetical protein
MVIKILKFKLKTKKTILMIKVIMIVIVINLVTKIISKSLNKNKLTKIIRIISKFLNKNKMNKINSKSFNKNYWKVVIWVNKMMILMVMGPGFSQIQTLKIISLVVRNFTRTKKLLFKLKKLVWNWKKRKKSD